MNKKILYYDWDSLMQTDMLAACEQAGYQVVRTTLRMKNYLQDAVFEEYLAKTLRNEGADFCFSLNYFPVISLVCEREGVPYISWIFDSPLLNLYSRAAALPCNRIFHFDRAECDRLAKLGIQTVSHLQLAARPEKTTLSGRLLHEISFVGRLYDKKNFYDRIKYLPEHVKGFLEGLMEAQRHVWGYNFLEDCLLNRPDMLQEFQKYVRLECTEDVFYTEEQAVACLFLAQKLTSIERLEALKYLAQIAQVELYSDSCPPELAGFPGLCYMGTVESECAAPRVYAESRINLNLTMRSIQSGVPLRVFDIAAAGGFVLTNYQPELAECFEPGRELVIYGSPEEMSELAQYYLTHESERAAIAAAAGKRVQAEHTFAHRLGILFAGV